MKVEYEPNDIVEVMDDINAGIFAACTVKLLTLQGEYWLCEFVDCVGGKVCPKQALVKEKYFL